MKVEVEHPISSLVFQSSPYITFTLVSPAMTVRKSDPRALGTGGNQKSSQSTLFCKVHIVRVVRAFWDVHYPIP